MTTPTDARALAQRVLQRKAHIPDAAMSLQERDERALARALIEAMDDLKDWEDERLKILYGPCASDERHCTCVPALYVSRARWRELARFGGSSPPPQTYLDVLAALEAEEAGNG